MSAKLSFFKNCFELKGLENFLGTQFANVDLYLDVLIQLKGDEPKHNTDYGFKPSMTNNEPAPTAADWSHWANDKALGKAAKTLDRATAGLLPAVQSSRTRYLRNIMSQWFAISK